MASLCVFGDSIVWGTGDKELGGWVNRLRLSLESKINDVAVYNLGIDGETTDRLSVRFKSEAVARDADIVIISMGANDSAATDDSGNLFISPEAFRENLATMARESVTAGYAVIFMGFEDIDESQTNPVPWANLYYSQEDLDKYSKIAEEIAGEFGCYFLGIDNLLKAEDLEDGLHPNSEGHAKIAEAVENFLIENKIINT